MKKILLFIPLFILLSWTGLTAQSYKIIAHSGNNSGSLTVKEVSDIFLKRTTRWGDGSAVMPVDLAPSVATRADFTKVIHGRTIPAIRSYWQQAAFSGAGSPPPEQATDAAVLEYVKSHPGAIGYVSASFNTTGVKTINVQ